MENYKSATNPVNRPMVEQTIRQEIALGNYVVSPTKPRIVSALGAIPKPSSPEIRLIHDCSSPHGQAVNDYITTNSFKSQGVLRRQQTISRRLNKLTVLILRLLKLTCSDNNS